MCYVSGDLRLHLQQVREHNAFLCAVDRLSESDFRLVQRLRGTTQSTYASINGTTDDTNTGAVDCLSQRKEYVTIARTQRQAEYIVALQEEGLNG